MTAQPESFAPVARSPLGSHADRLAAVAAAAGDTLAFREIPNLSQINLRADMLDPELGPAVQGVLGAAPPTTPNTVAAGAGLEVLWLGPREWLVVSDSRAAADLTAALDSALASRWHLVVDVSGNRTVLEIAGAAARDLLARGCSIDLHPRAFGPGQVVQTTLAKAQVMLQQTDARPTYRVFVRASFARYLADWVLDAARAWTE